MSSSASNRVPASLGASKFSSGHLLFLTQITHDSISQCLYYCAMAPILRSDFIFIVASFEPHSRDYQ